MEFREEIIFTGGINTDDDARAVPRGDYRDMTYSRLGEVTGHGFAVVTSLGTVEITNSSLTSADRVLGGFVWENENAIVYPVYKFGADDEIWAYNISSQTNTLIVSSSAFNFQPDIPILHGNVIGDIFKFVQGYWTDAMYDENNGDRLFNPPYQINLRKALDGDYPVVDLQVIDAIKWPLAPPVCVYDTDQSRADNKLRRKLFKFMVQPIYENNEEGNWSMYSNLALPTQSEFVSGTNWPDSSQDNVIHVTFNTGANVIKKINVAVQQFDENSGGVENPFGLFLQLDKVQDNIPDNTDYTIDFYGGVSTKPIVYSKNYDRLPLWANCQEYLVTNELTYVNFREGFDKIVIDAQADYIKNEISWNPESEINNIEISFNAPPNKFRMFSQAPFDPSAYFPFKVGMNFTFSSANNLLITYTITQQDINDALAEPTISDSNLLIFQRMGDSFTDQMGSPNGTVSIVGAVFLYESNWTETSDLYFTTLTQDRQTEVVRSLKQGATHQFGIVYFDRGYRDSTVYTIDSLSTYVKMAGQEDLSAFTDPNDPYYVVPKITIQNLPPVWATHYAIVARASTEILSFGQYTINSDPTLDSAIYTDGGRYRIEIDKYYYTENLGATINHQIQKGDIVRFIRKRLDNAVPTPTSGYVSNYFELEVLDYSNNGGFDGRQEIWVEKFDLTLIDPDTWKGQLIEIYTPRPSLDTNGNLFVAEWRDCTGAIEIINPHTLDRAHMGSEITGLVSSGGTAGQLSVFTTTDLSNFVGDPYNAEVVLTNDASDTQTLTSIAIVDVGGGEYKIVFDVTLSFDFSSAAGGRFVLSSRQQSSGGTSLLPAILNLDYGDVYVRQRNYATGYASVNTSAYWFIEDPCYSDYWTSNIHEVGRFRVEDPNAKLVHRQASAIHSASYILNTQVNGLSTFSLNNDNIQDMNPIHGPVTRVFNSGRDGKTLKCLQPRKENSIYINFYPDVTDTPQGNLRVDRNRTFSSWFDFHSFYGCKDGGGAALLPDGSAIYFDPITQAFIYSAGNGQMVVSELDPLTKNNFKFRKKTREVVQRFASEGSFVKTYVNESMGEVGFCFGFAVLPRTGGDINYIGIDQTETGVTGDYTAYIGQQINFEINTDDPENPIYYFSTTITDAAYYNSFPLFNTTVFTLADPSPITGTTGTFVIEPKIEYEILVFDYVRMRWRARYDYNFQCFANFGSILLGFGTNQQPYLHNQNGSFTFHGDNALQTVTCVSNDSPMLLKRYQTLIERADKTWGFSCYADTNQSYTQMGTEMKNYLFEVLEGYSQVDFRKNMFDPSCPSQEYAMMNSEEDIRANALTMTIDYDPVENNSSCVLFSLGIKGVLS